MHPAHNYKYEIKEKKKNKVKIEVVVDYAEYEKYEQESIKRLASTVKVPGFRPGKAPKDMVQGQVAAKAMNNAVNALLPHLAEHILSDEKMNPIAPIDYDLKELDKEKGLIFEMEFYDHPEIKADQFKKLKVEEKSSEVTEAEVMEVIRNMISNNKPKDEKEEDEEKKDEEFEVTDEMVAELKYDNETTLEGLKGKVREAMENLKKEQMTNQFANEVIEEALKLSDFELPESIVEDSAIRSEEDFKSRLAQIKLDLGAYLKTQNTTLEEQRKLWREEAEKQIKTDLLVINLAVSENLTPSEEELESEINKIQDKKVQEQYRNNPGNMNYMRTMMARERGLNRLLDIARGK